MEARRHSVLGDHSSEQPEEREWWGQEEGKARVQDRGCVKGSHILRATRI